jgi:hypothetical protein
MIFLYYNDDDIPSEATIQSEKGRGNLNFM